MNPTPNQLLFDDTAANYRAHKDDMIAAIGRYAETVARYVIAATAGIDTDPAYAIRDDNSRWSIELHDQTLIPIDTHPGLTHHQRRAAVSVLNGLGDELGALIYGCTPTAIAITTH